LSFEAVIPGGFNQDAPGVFVAGLGDRSQVAANSFSNPDTALAVPPRCE
jgi:hypothetical protein